MARKETCFFVKFKLSDLFYTHLSSCILESYYHSLSIKRVILTAPSGNFYGHVLKGLANGFSSIGVDAFWNNTDPNINSLIDVLPSVNPVAVIQINRVLQVGQFWPAHIKHASWIQDYRFDGYDLTKDLGSGEMIYFLIHPSSFGISIPAEQKWSILLPGARPHEKCALQNQVRDFSFVGFISTCVNYDLPIPKDAGGFIPLKDFLDQYPKHLLSQSSFSLPSIRAAVENCARNLGCSNLLQNNELLQIFDEQLPRSYDRRRLIDTILAISKNTEIYGHNNWLSWAQYKEFYKGSIDNPIDCDSIYRTSRINLHNSGLGMHYRVLDCMATGSFILVNENPYDILQGGILKHFVPGTHYGSYTFENLSVVASKYLADSKSRSLISQTAREEVMRSHTWKHRALQICSDLGISHSTSTTAISKFVAMPSSARIVKKWYFFWKR